MATSRPSPPTARPDHPVKFLRESRFQANDLAYLPSLIPTKAARVFLAAHGDPAVDFGLRRAQSADGALTADLP